MLLKDSEVLPEEKQGIERYATNDNFFRHPISFEQYASLSIRQFESFQGVWDYQATVHQLSRVVIIDLKDIDRFLKSHDTPGFGAIDVGLIAEIVCNYVGTDDLVDVLWCNLDDDIISEISARLGIDVDHHLMSEPFNTAMALVVEIGRLIENYLVNARFPLVNRESVYKAVDYKNGLLALRLRTYDELKELY